MLTLLLSLLAMVGFWVGFHYGLQWGAWGVVLSIFLGSAMFMGGMYLIRRRITAIMAAIQARITERNNTLMRKYQQLGNRNGGNVKQLMDQARRDQDAILTEALESTRKMDPYAKWSLLLDRQINAIRLQFLYQLRRFEEVDRILPKTLFADPVLCCMKMCRQYKRGEDAALQKSYDKYRKKYKFDATLIYATYAWMLLRKKQKDQARQVLMDGKKATENEILEKNWEHVTNDRLNQFSNAELGESWYALLLEEPKQPKVQRQVQRRRF
jgi:hypothetical protein